MATLLHHIHPWMQKSITESEESLERKMVKFTERKIAEVNQRLDVSTSLSGGCVDSYGCS